MNAPHAAAPDRAHAPAPGPLRPFRFPAVRRASLPNGVEVMVAEVRNFPVVTFEVVLGAAGAVTEPAEKAGVSVLASSLLESGAGGRSADEIAEAVDSLGLSLDSTASWDTTQAGFTALASRLEAGCELVADLVLRPAFPEGEVGRIREERLGSIRHRRADPSGLAGEVFPLYAFAPGSPYALPLGGSAATVATIGRDDVAAFHAARYRPQGTTLAAAGDVSLEEVVSLAERFFGGWEGAPPPAPAPEPRPRFTEPRIVVAHRPGAVQSEVRVGHLGVDRLHPRYFSLLVMNAILGGTFTSRLNLNLRERLGYTYGASSSWTLRRQRGLFYVGAAVQTEVTAHSVSEMLREIREFREAPVTASELEDARSYMADVFPVTLQTTEGVCAKLTSLAAYGLPDDYYDSYRERVMAVGAEDVLETARELLRPEEAVVVVVGDADKVRGELEALGVAPVEVIDPAEVLV